MGNMETFWGRFVIGMEAGAKAILKLFQEGPEILPDVMVEISNELEKQKK